jgi:hypothetical protein
MMIIYRRAISPETGDIGWIRYQIEHGHPYFTKSYIIISPSIIPGTADYISHAIINAYQREEKIRRKASKQSSASIPLFPIDQLYCLFNTENNHAQLRSRSTLESWVKQQLAPQTLRQNQNAKQTGSKSCWACLCPKKPRKNSRKVTPSDASSHKTKAPNTTTPGTLTSPNR